MTIVMGSDHRGFELKNKLIEYLQQKNIRVDDMGAYDLDPHDDNPDFAKKVARGVLQNQQDFLGIVICGSGVGVSITANRFKGIYCGLGISPRQVEAARRDDHMNVLALASDFITFEEAQALVDAFITTTPDPDERFIRRLHKIDAI